MFVPKRLKPGDTVGIITPSYPTPSLHPERLTKGIEVLEKEFGLKVKLGDSVSKKTGHLAGNREERAQDINLFLADPEIQAIWFSAGGYNSNALLSLIDYKPIAKYPKIIIGYSDATALLIGIYKQTGLVTFHGPTICREFGGFPKPFPYTLQNCRKALFESKPLGKLNPPEAWTSDSPSDLENGNTEPIMIPATPWRWLKRGIARGRLVGGNLQTFLALYNTAFWPTLQGAILFWEEMDLNVAQLHRYLTQCRMIGVFDKIAGMVVGQPNLRPLESELPLDEVLLDVTRGLNFPILIDVDCGHTDPMLTLPIGVQAKLDSENDLFSIEEAATKK